MGVRVAGGEEGEEEKRGCDKDEDGAGEGPGGEEGGDEIVEGFDGGGNVGHAGALVDLC